MDSAPLIQTGVMYYLRGFTVAVGTHQTPLVSIPFMFALVAIDDLATSEGVKVAIRGAAASR